jgi:stress response protein YsnF
VRKRPVVREELRVRKSTVEELRSASAEVRREHAHLDESVAESARSSSDEPDGA